VNAKAGQIGQLVRTLGTQIKDALKDALGSEVKEAQVMSHRAEVVSKVSRNAVAELVNQARNHPQRGDLTSANPAYVALSELCGITGIPGLALGLRNETGEIIFLDLDKDPEKARESGGVYVDRQQNRNLWRQLKHLVALKVDRTMLGPTPPIRSPEDLDLPEEAVDKNED
jgi:hypothetical protein